MEIIAFFLEAEVGMKTNYNKDHQKLCPQQKRKSYQIGRVIFKYSEFLLQSQSQVNFFFNTEYHIWNSIFLDEDIVSASKFLSEQAFEAIKLKKSVLERQQKFLPQLQKARIPIQNLVTISCFPQLSKAMFPIPEEEDFIQFQYTTITPQNCIIAYKGRRKHNEILNIFQEILTNSQNFFGRQFILNQEKTQFKSAVVRIEDPFSSAFEIAILFEGASLLDKEMFAIEMILSEILGNIDSHACKAEIGIKVKSRCYDSLLQHNRFLENAGSVTQNFTDCGRFGIIVQGNTLNKQQIYDLAIQELLKLRRISDSEIERAKNIAITKYFVGLERQYMQFIEEVTHMAFHGNLYDKYEYPDSILSITRKQLEERVEQLLKTNKIQVLYIGKGANLMPDDKMTIARLSY